MLMLLEHYGITLRQSGVHRLAGACPLHHGDNTDAFQLGHEKKSFPLFYSLRRRFYLRFCHEKGEPLFLPGRTQNLQNLQFTKPTQQNKTHPKTTVDQKEHSFQIEPAI